MGAYPGEHYCPSRKRAEELDKLIGSNNDIWYWDEQSMGWRLLDRG